MNETIEERRASGRAALGADPRDPLDVATKQYVDAMAGGGSGAAGSVIEELNTQISADMSAGGLLAVGSPMLVAPGAIQVGKGYRYRVSGACLRPVSSTVQLLLYLGNLSIFTWIAVSAGTSIVRFDMDVSFYVVGTTTVWVSGRYFFASGLNPPPATSATQWQMAEGSITGLNFASPLQLMANYATPGAGNLVERRRAVVYTG